MSCEVILGIVYHDPCFGERALIEMESVGLTALTKSLVSSKPYREGYGASRGGFPYW